MIVIGRFAMDIKIRSAHDTAREARIDNSSFSKYASSENSRSSTEK